MGSTCPELRRKWLEGKKPLIWPHPTCGFCSTKDMCHCGFAQQTWQQQHLQAESPFGFRFGLGVDVSKNRQRVLQLQAQLQAVVEQEQEQHQRAGRLHDEIQKIIAHETDALVLWMVGHGKQDEIEVKKSPLQTNILEQLHPEPQDTGQAQDAGTHIYTHTGGTHLPDTHVTYTYTQGDQNTTGQHVHPLTSAPNHTQIILPSPIQHTRAAERAVVAV